MTSMITYGSMMSACARQSFWKLAAWTGPQVFEYELDRQGQCRNVLNSDTHYMILLSCLPEFNQQRLMIWSPGFPHLAGDVS